MSRLAIGGVSYSTDITTISGAGFLSYDDPDNNQHFWAKEFTNTITPSQNMGIVDCAVRLPANYVYAAIYFPPLLMLLSGSTGSLITSQIILVGLLPLSTYTVVISAIFYHSSTNQIIV